MDLKADIRFEQVDVPDGYWCENGHQAPELYRRDGPDSDLLPIRFWHMKGCGIDRIICEPCMTIINYMIFNKRKKKKEENGR